MAAETTSSKSVPRSSTSGLVEVRFLPSNVDKDYEQRKIGAPRRLPTETAGQLVRSELLTHSSLNRLGGNQCAPRQNNIDTAAAAPNGIDRDDRASSIWTTVDVTLERQSSSPVDNDTDPNKRHIKLQMNRKSDEAVGKSLQRMVLSLQKKLKSKSVANSSGRKPKVMLLREAIVEEGAPSKTKADDNENRQREVESSASHIDTWNTTDQFTIELLLPDEHGNDGTISCHLPVRVCPPTILSVTTFESFESRCFVGIPLFVQVESLFTSHVLVNWFTVDVNKDDEHASEEEGRETLSTTLVANDTHLFTPTVDHVGKQIRVVVLPVRTTIETTLGQAVTPKDALHANVRVHGTPEVYEYLYPVEDRPKNALLTVRESWLNTSSTNSQEGQSASKPMQPEEEQPELSSLDIATRVRIVTYNILADQNAFPKESNGNYSFYPYCSEAILDRRRRMPLILHELLTYQADIICLQEVDEYVYRQLFQPLLVKAEAYHYDGFFSAKDGTGEGCAMFWNIHRFEQASAVPQTTYIRDIAREHENGDKILPSWQEGFQEIWTLLHQHDELRSILLGRLGHVLQTVQLTLKRDEHSVVNEVTSKGTTTLLVANTHLFFHPYASHIRLIQLWLSCYKLASFMSEVQHSQKQQSKESAMSSAQALFPKIIYCGDFNSSPGSGSHRLLTRRFVLPSNDGRTDTGTTWKHLWTFVWEASNEDTDLAGDREKVVIPVIRLPDSFPRLISGLQSDHDKDNKGEGPPRTIFTHYLPSFHEMLDYIWLGNFGAETPGAAVAVAAPMPKEEDLTRYTAMPSPLLPSDHVSLVCDVMV